MRFVDLSYKIGDCVYTPKDILDVSADGSEFRMRVLESASEDVVKISTITCPVRMVEVVSQAEDQYAYYSPGTG